MFNKKKLQSEFSRVRNLILLVALLAVTAGISLGADDGVAVASTEVIAEVQEISFQPDMTIQQALRILAEKYQKNIVPSTSVDGTLSFTRLYSVTFDEAMDAILGPNLKYEQVGQLYKVYTKDEYLKIKQDVARMEHRVFTVYYLTSKEAVSLIEPVLSKSRVIQASTLAETGSAGASGSPSGGTSGGSLGSGGGGDSMAQNDTIVVYDFPENLAKAEDVLRSLDKRPKQVLVEATILSARLVEGMELGVDLNLMAGASLDGTSSTDTLVSEGTISRGTEATSPIAEIGSLGTGGMFETSGLATAGGSGLRVGIRSGDVRLFISALEAITDTTVLANPKIIAVNKMEGSVLVGRNLGYRSSTSISTGGTATEGEVEFLQTGTQLVFRPFIGDDGYVRMDIYPKDSTAELNADGVPDESTTELRTNIMVRDGETIVLGGLFRDSIVSTRQQIPLLGDLPIIGALFRSTSDSTVREEVIVLLNVHIIDGANQTDGEARAADIGRKRYGARMSLQGISRNRLAEDRYVSAVKSYADGNSVDALSDLDSSLALRPTYLEALRLKERITREITPDKAREIERLMLGVIEDEEAAHWQRR
jgi:type IV pilus assembly protein PilQ